MSKQDRQGVRTASDLEQKYNFDKTFAELMGIATDARDKVDSVESTLRSEIEEQYTTISRDTEKVIVEALKSYVETDELTEYQKTVESQFQVMAEEVSAKITSTEKKITEVKDDLTGQVEAFEEYRESTESEFAVMSDQISLNLSSTTEQYSSVQREVDALGEELAEQEMDFERLREENSSELKLLSDKMEVNFESTTEQFSSINGGLQSVKEAMEKHFEFSADGLIIKAGPGTMQLLVDNDVIRFVKNGQEFGWWDGVDFHTGNIVVEVSERAQFGNFAFVPRTNGSLDILKIDDYVAAAITKHPSSKTVGATYVSATFSVTAVGTGITYQWQYSTNGTSWSNVSSGTTSSISVSFTSTSIKKRYYRCKVTDAKGKTVTSNVATFTLYIA